MSDISNKNNIYSIIKNNIYLVIIKYKKIYLIIK